MTPIEDAGDFLVVVEEPENEEFLNLYKAYQDGPFLQSIADLLNGSFSLPQDIPITAKECGEANAFYDPETVSIEVCYELVMELAQVFAEIAEDPKDTKAIAHAVDGEMMATIYHEVGHALIDQYNLPTTGKEEDAVDQLSVLFMATSAEDWPELILNGAKYYLKASEEVTDIEDLAFWDTHSLDQQRFFHLVCWTFGQNPDEREFLVTDGWLPEDRAERCPSEYAQMAHSWDVLLAPYVKGNEDLDVPDGWQHEPIEDRGQFTVSYEKPEDATFEDAYAMVSTDNAFGEVTSALNETFALPADLNVVFKQCEEFAYYDPSEKQLTFCYEIIPYLEQIYTDAAEDPEDTEAITNQTLNGLLFIFFHEMGHALIDLYKLPTTGLEEDAVDQLAALLITGDDAETSKDALAGAETFAASIPEDLSVEDLPFADEHSLGQQRFYNIVCWVYGHDPEANSDMVGDDALPEDRAAYCPEEWSKLEQAWMVLLAPFVKETE